LAAPDVSIETVRPDGARQRFGMAARAGYLESNDEISEPHAFTAHVRIGGRDMGGEDHPVVFEEHDHAGEAVARDYNMQAAIVHVMADAAVSVLVITGLVLALMFGWLWMDPLAGIVGACVIASWAYGLIRNAGAILLDMNPDRDMEGRLRQTIESEEIGLPTCISGAWAPGISGPSSRWSPRDTATQIIIARGWRGSARCRISRSR
jgi:hypothetical protein